MCRPKKLGGWGILNIKDFNNAMLAKWYWQWQTKEQRLWKDLFKTLYGDVGTQGVKGSYLFRIHLKQIYNLCENFIRRIPAQGDTVQFWNEDWGMGMLKYRLEILYTFVIQQDMTLAQFTQQSRFQINAQMFKPVLTEEAQEQMEILQEIWQAHRINTQLQTNNQPNQDDAVWKMDEKGFFTVSSAYRILQKGPHISSSIHRIWKFRVPPRFKTFAWLLIHNRLLTTDNLRKRGYNLPGICYMCRANDETIQHLFNECQQARILYTAVLGQGQHIQNDSISVITEGPTEKIRELVLISQFILWRERCCRIFRDKSKTTAELTQEATNQWEMLANKCTRRSNIT